MSLLNDELKARDSKFIENQNISDKYRDDAINDIQHNDIESALKNILLVESLCSGDQSRMATITMVRARLEYIQGNFVDSLFLHITARMEWKKYGYVDKSWIDMSNLYMLKASVACDEPRHLINFRLDKIIDSVEDPKTVKRAKSIAKGKLWNWIDDKLNT